MVRYTGHVACIGEKGNAYRVLMWTLEEMGPLE
jgi:hypothetical protein